MSSPCALRRGGAAWWAAVHTQPHREQAAHANLERQGFVTYCPVVRRRRSHARRMDEVLRPLFPGYLFVNVSLEREFWRPILSTYGVRTLVRCGDRPSLVDARFIGALKAREIGGAIVRPSVPYQVGQRVRVVAGGFEDVVATILSLDEKDRLTVLLDLLGRPVRARLDGTQVSAL